MRYRLLINADPKRKLRLLPKQIRQEIGFKIFLMQEGLTGDVKKLQDPRNLYRLRVGSYRVIFKLDGETIMIYDIGNRKDIYK